MEYDNGVFRPYLTNKAANGGKVIFTQVPFGEYTANKLTSDNFHDQKNSVYSRAAAIERKIEIQSVDYLHEDSLSFITEISPRFIDLTAIQQNQEFKRSVLLKNKSSVPLEIEKFTVKNDYIKIIAPTIIPAGTSTIIEFESLNLLPKGLFSFPVTIYFKDYTTPITIMVNGEGF